MPKYFSKAIFLATLRRYWVGSALLTIMLAFNALAYYQSTLRLLQSSLHGMYDTERQYRAALQVITDPSALILVVIAAVVSAILVFSYLNDKRAVVMMHALPVRREAYFTSTFLGGLTLLWAPVLAYAATLIAMQASAGALIWPIVPVWLCMAFLFSLLAYSLVIFAGQLTGNAFAQFLIAGIIIALPLLVELFIMAHFELFLYGFDSPAGTPVNMAANPIVLMVLLISDMGNWFSVSDPGGHFSITGGITGAQVFHIALVLAFIAVLIAASLLLYRKRHLEMAGEFIAVRAMRPVFRYSSAFFAAFFFEFLGAGFFRNSPSAMILFALFGGALGWLAADMFIRKTVMVFRYMKGAAVFSGCFLLVFFLIYSDIFGYGSYQPPKNQIESVYFHTEPMPHTQSPAWDIEPMPYFFTDEAGIDAALALHKYIITERPAFENHDAMTDYGYFNTAASFHSYYLNIKLTNGRTVTRAYHFPIYGENAQFSALAGALDDLAKPKLIERLRNLGRAGKPLYLSWVFTSGEYNIIRDMMPAGHAAPFIDAVIADNLEHPHWHINRFGGQQLSFLFDGAPGSVAGRFYNNASGPWIFVRPDDDRNAMSWLLENGYIARWEDMDKNDYKYDEDRLLYVSA
jgi:ABC-2 type transport system permease protein